MDRKAIFALSARNHGYLYHPTDGIYTKSIGAVLFTLASTPSMGVGKRMCFAAFKICNGTLQPFVSYQIPLVPKYGGEDIFFTSAHVPTREKIEDCIAKAEAYAGYMDDLWSPLFAPYDNKWPFRYWQIPQEVKDYFAGRCTTIQQDVDELRNLIANGEHRTAEYAQKFEAFENRVGSDFDEIANLKIDELRWQYAHPDEEEAFG
jgi:hypothetical protein